MQKVAIYLCPIFIFFLINSVIWKFWQVIYTNFFLNQTLYFENSSEDWFVCGWWENFSKYIVIIGRNESNISPIERRILGGVWMCMFKVIIVTWRIITSWITHVITARNRIVRRWTECKNSNKLSFFFLYYSILLSLHSITTLYLQLFSS